ncbi:MAG: DUF3592 domain-containing protein [Alistipes sp.]|nr:DUF3592 domain-containing protein [Alistipes sp.]
MSLFGQFGRSRLWKFVFSWLLVGLGVWLGVSVAHGLRLNRRFRVSGVESTGVVTRVYTKTEYRTERITRRSSRRVKISVHYLDYRFSVDDRIFEGSQRLGQHFVDVRKGDSIVVLYLPDDPAYSRLARDEEKNFRIKRMRARSRLR